MSREDATREERLKKLNKLKEKGIEPYPTKTQRDHSVEQLLSDFDAYVDEQKEVTIAGRVMSMREHGGMIFTDVFDGTNKMQIVSQIEHTGEDIHRLLSELVDKSDFVEFSGVAFYTKRGQPSLKISNWKMLSKAILPVPGEWQGLKAEETRHRKRYLDILLNPGVREMMERRSKFWQTIRNFFLEEDFMEVETPVFETVPGGGDARPFITYHNALDLNVYLRISAGELWQKRMMVAGFNKIFEIGRIFRNEGMSHEHLQEYTQMEFYKAYSDYNEGMKMVRTLYQRIADEVYNTRQFSIRGYEVDLSGDEWGTVDFSGVIKERYGVDPLEDSKEELVNALDENGIEYDSSAINKARAADQLWKSIRREIAGPVFLVGVPIYLEPLAKRSSENPETVERFQVIIAGSELGKGFSELNDPVDQRERFNEQQKLRDAGDEEAQMSDYDYVQAMEYGMPPCLGFGLSERLFSYLEDVSAREAQLFPLLRPKDGVEYRESGDGEESFTQEE